MVKVPVYNKTSIKFDAAKDAAEKERRRLREVEDANKTISGLKLQLLKTQESNKKAKDEFDKISSVYKEELNTLKKDLKEDKKKVLDAEVKLIELNTIKLKLKVELDVLTPQLEQLDPSIGFQPSTLKRLDELNLQLDSTTKEVSLIRDTVSTLENQSNHINYLIQDLNVEITRLNKAIEHSPTVITGIKNDLTRLRSTSASVDIWKINVKDTNTAKDVILENLKPVKISIRKLNRLKNANITFWKVFHERDELEVAFDDLEVEHQSYHNRVEQAEREIGLITRRMEERELNQKTNNQRLDRLIKSAGENEIAISLNLKMSNNNLDKLSKISKEIKSTVKQIQLVQQNIKEAKSIEIESLNQLKVLDLRSKENERRQQEAKYANEVSQQRAQEEEIRAVNNFRMKEAHEEVGLGYKEVERLERLIEEKMSKQSIRRNQSQRIIAPSPSPISSTINSKYSPSTSLVVNKLAATLQSLSLGVTALRSENTLLLMHLHTNT